VTLDEWQEWQIHPATKAFLSYLQQAQKELQRQWANGGFTQRVQTVQYSLMQKRWACIEHSLKYLS
jgi:hypothetical protein